MNDHRLVSLQWCDSVRGAQDRVIEPERLHNGLFTGYDAETDDMFEISHSAVTSVRILTSRESGKFIV